MIHLEQITEKTFYKVLRLKPLPEQENYIAPNVYSLAEAWLYQDKARPFVIMNDETPVGFIMLEWQEAEKECSIWRFMIDKNYQKNGFGKQAILQALDMIKSTNKFDIITLSCVETNEVAMKFYKSLGFKETNIKDEDEIILEMKIN